MSLLFPKGGKAPNELPSWVCRFVDGCCVLTCLSLPINKAWRYPPGPQSRSNKHLIVFLSMWTSHHVIDDYYHLDFATTACGTQTKQSGSAVDKVYIYIHTDISRRTLPNFLTGCFLCLTIQPFPINPWNDTRCVSWQRKGKFIIPKPQHDWVWLNAMLHRSLGWCIYIYNWITVQTRFVNADFIIAMTCSRDISICKIVFLRFSLDSYASCGPHSSQPWQKIASMCQGHICTAAEIAEELCKSGEIPLGEYHWIVIPQVMEVEFVTCERK